MQVRMLVSMAGVDAAWDRGDVKDCSSEEAVRLIQAGYAEPMRGTVVETAALEPVTEKATARRKRKNS